MAQIIKQCDVIIEEPPKVERCTNEPLALMCEEEKAHLWQKAFDEGHAAAVLESQRMRQEAIDLKEQLTTLMAAIPEAIEQARLALQPEIAAISLLIIQRYFIEQAQDTKILEHKINHLLNEVNQHQSITLYLHPRDIHLLQNGTIQLNKTQSQITIKTDDALALGGFIIKTQHGVFDASVERQLNQLKACLTELHSVEHSS